MLPKVPLRYLLWLTSYNDCWPMIQRVSLHYLLGLLTHVTKGLLRLAIMTVDPCSKPCPCTTHYACWPVVQTVSLHYLLWSLVHVRVNALTFDFRAVDTCHRQCPYAVMTVGTCVRQWSYVVINADARRRVIIGMMNVNTHERQYPYSKCSDCQQDGERGWTNKDWHRKPDLTVK